MRRIAIIIGLACIASEAISQAREEVVLMKPDPVELPIAQVSYKEPLIDTVRVTVMCYTKIPGYVFTRPGYCVRKNRICIRAHLRDDKTKFKLPVHAFMCIDEEGE